MLAGAEDDAGVEGITGAEGAEGAAVAAGAEVTTGAGKAVSFACLPFFLATFFGAGASTRGGGGVLVGAGETSGACVFVGGAIRGGGFNIGSFDVAGA